MALASLTEIKAALNITGTDKDAQITALLEPVSALIEREAGQTFTPAEYIEDHPGGEPTISLHRYPAVEGGSPAMTVTDLITGEVLAATDYELDGELGLLRRLPLGTQWARATYSPLVYLGEQQHVMRWRISYTGGASDVPGDIKMALYYSMAGLVGSGDEAAGGGGLDGIISERDGDYSYTRAAGSAISTGGSLSLPAAALDICRSYKREFFV